MAQDILMLNSPIDGELLCWSKVAKTLELCSTLETGVDLDSMVSVGMTLVSDLRLEEV